MTDYPSNQQTSEEETFNTILKKIDEEFYFEECNRDIYDKDKTAFDVIARINNLEHERLNIYKDQQGKLYILSKLGFQPLIVYNKGIENLKLRAELDFKNSTISNLSAKLEKNKNALAQEKESASIQREKNKKLNSNVYQKLVLSTEAKRINKKLSKINKTMLDNVFQNESNSFEGADYTNESDIKQILMRTIKENAKLKNVLLSSSFQISEITDYIIVKSIITD